MHIYSIRQFRTAMDFRLDLGQNQQFPLQQVSSLNIDIVQWKDKVFYSLSLLSQQEFQSEVEHSVGLS